MSENTNIQQKKEMKKENDYLGVWDPVDDIEDFSLNKAIRFKSYNFVFFNFLLELFASNQSL